MFNLFRKGKNNNKKPEKSKRPGKRAKTKETSSKDILEIKTMLKRLSTKNDVKAVMSEIVSSRDALIGEINSIPSKKVIAKLMTEKITQPLQDFISQSSSNQAVKQVGIKQLSSNQAVKSLDDVVSEMKVRMDMLTPRHLKVLSVLVNNRNEWLGYGDIGSICSPQLSGSCIRGYVADLINVYKIPIDKKNFGKQSRIRVPEEVFKQLAISKLID